MYNVQCTMYMYRIREPEVYLCCDIEGKVLSLVGDDGLVVVLIQFKRRGVESHLFYISWNHKLLFSSGNLVGSRAGQQYQQQAKHFGVCKGTPVSAEVDLQMSWFSWFWYYFYFFLDVFLHSVICFFWPNPFNFNMNRMSYWHNEALCFFSRRVYDITELRS